MAAAPIATTTAMTASAVIMISLGPMGLLYPHGSLWIVGYLADTRGGKWHRTAVRNLLRGSHNVMAVGIDARLSSRAVDVSVDFLSVQVCTHCGDHGHGREQ